MSTFTAVVRLGKDAEQRVVGQNTVTSFSGCYNTGYGDKKVATWVRCSYWRKSDGLMPYLIKGAQIEVTGECYLREYESNGKTGVSLELTVDRICLVGGANQQGTAQPADQPDNFEEFNDDVPF